MDDAPNPRAKKPFARWSADTEQAFLLALRLTGQATKAAQEIGRGLSAAYTRRQRDPDFARAWDEAVAHGQAEWAAQCVAARGPLDDGAGDGRQGRGRGRVDGWDSRRRGAFLRVLTRTKDVRAACRAAGMSAAAAYQLRGRSPPFARAWSKALAADAPSVLDAAHDRAINGWVEPIVAGGKVIGERRRYSDSLLGALLRHELCMAQAAARKDPEMLERAKPAGQTGRGAAARAAEDDETRDLTRRDLARRYPRATEEETNAALSKKLDAVEKRMRREAAERQEKEWGQWRKCWGAFGRPGWGRVSRLDDEDGDGAWVAPDDAST